jgi:acyl carrier protein
MAVERRRVRSEACRHKLLDGHSRDSRPLRAFDGLQGGHRSISKPRLGFASSPLDRRGMKMVPASRAARHQSVRPVATTTVMPASRLDRDLGIDSIGRTELVLRIECLLRLKLPASVLTETETVGDLIEAIERAVMRAAPVHTVSASPPTLPPVDHRTCRGRREERGYPNGAVRACGRSAARPAFRAPRGCWRN